METDKNDSQNESMDTSEDKKDEGDAKEGVYSCFRLFAFITYFQRKYFQKRKRRRKLNSENHL